MTLILESRTLASLLKTMASIPFQIRLGTRPGIVKRSGTCPGVVKRSRTPTSIVRLIVEILEPYHGRILDPACGSGGMFIQSARFVEAHQKNPTAEISIHGQDQWAWGAHLRRAQRARRVRQRRKLPNQRVTDTARLARLNLAVHGLSGDIKQGNTYYEDLQDSVNRFARSQCLIFNGKS